MPVWLRKFTFNKLKDWYEKKNNNNKESNEDSWIKGAARDEALKNKTRNEASWMKGNTYDGTFKNKIKNETPQNKTTLPINPTSSPRFKK